MQPMHHNRQLIFCLNYAKEKTHRHIEVQMVSRRILFLKESEK